MSKTQIEIGGRKLQDYKLKKGQFIDFRSDGQNPGQTLQQGYEPISADPRIGLIIKGNLKIFC